MKSEQLRAAEAGSGMRVLALPGAALVCEVDGSGPAVVLVHGFGLDMGMWEPQVPMLAADFLVVRYDCRGFGSTGPFDSAVPCTHADDLITLLDQLGIAEAVLDGVPWDPESAAALHDVARAVQRGGVRAGRAAWLAHPLFAVARQRTELASQLADMVSGYPGQHWLGQDPHRADPRPPIEALEELAMPALVIAGDHDVPGFRAMSDVLARRIPGAEYRRVGAAGHMVNMEQPEIVNDLLINFLTKLSSG